MTLKQRLKAAAKARQAEYLEAERVETKPEQAAVAGTSGGGLETFDAAIPAGPDDVEPAESDHS